MTGRPRRCGWFDCVQCKKAVNIGTIDSIALTKIDVLDDLKEINICYAYKIGKKILKSMPNSIFLLNKIKPQYLTIRGWQSKTRGIKNVKDLPNQAKKLIKTLEKMIKVPIVMISTGPNREDVIYLKKF